MGLSTRGAEGIQLKITANEGGGVIDAAGKNPVGVTLEEGVLTRAYLTIVSSFKIMLKTGVCQVSD